MSISLNPQAWIFNYIENKKERKVKIADYLDKIASAAFDLAQAWEKVALSILTHGEIDEESGKLLKALIETEELVELTNVGYMSRLSGFYNRISKVLGERYRELTDLVVYKIGTILKTRNLTKAKIEVELKNIKSAVFFDDPNEDYTDVSIIESIKILHREAAALYVIAQEFRAMI